MSATTFGAAVDAKVNCSKCGIARFFDMADSTQPRLAAERAEQRLGLVRDHVDSEIDRAIVRMGSVLATCRKNPAERPYELLKDSARIIHAASGEFGFGLLGITAYMMHDHIETMEDLRSWDAEGLALYYETIRSLREDETATGCREVLAGLRSLTNKRTAAMLGADRAAPHTPRGATSAG